jgi:hypothetical protein
MEFHNDLSSSLHVICHSLSELYTSCISAYVYD